MNLDTTRAAGGDAAANIEISTGEQRLGHGPLHDDS